MLFAFTLSTFGILLNLALLLLGTRFLFVRFTLHGELTAVLHLPEAGSFLFLLLLLLARDSEHQPMALD